MFKVIQGPLPDNIDPERLREDQERVRKRREAEVEARKGTDREYIDSPEHNSAFIDHLLNFPVLDVDDDFWGRIRRGEPDVPR